MDISGFIDKALGGDVKLLKQAHRDNSEELRASIRGRMGTGSINLLHTAAATNNCDFLREALRLLPEELILDLICQGDVNDSNPLHCAAEEGNIFAVELLVNAYVKSAIAVQKQHTPPFFMKKSFHHTPLHCCFNKENIQRSHEHVAKLLVSVDQHLLQTWGEQGFWTPYSDGQSSTTILDKNGRSIVFCAMREGFSLLVKQLLVSTSNPRMDGWFSETPLHYASKCKEDVSQLLLQRYPELIGKVSNNETTMLHKAVRDGATWLVKLMLMADEEGKPRPWNKACRRLIWYTTSKISGAETALHIAAKKGYTNIAKIIIQAYESMIEHEPTEWLLDDNVVCAYPAANHCMGRTPWGIKNSNEHIPLFVALQNGRDEFGVYMLSLETSSSNLTSLERDECKTVLNLAIAKGCRQSAEMIFEVTLGRRAEYLAQWASGKNTEFDLNVLKFIKHIAAIYQERGEMLTIDRLERLEKLFLDFKQKPNRGAEVYLVHAAIKGEDWLVKLFLEADMSSIQPKVVTAFRKACDMGHMSTLMAFIDHRSSTTSGSCLEYLVLEQLNPLHHIKHLEYEQCKQLLENPKLRLLINQVGEDGDTPLHRAVRHSYLGLTEALVEVETLDSVLISRKDDKRALDLIADRCETKSSDDNKFWFKIYKKLLAEPEMLKKEGNIVKTFRRAIEWDDLIWAAKLFDTAAKDLNAIELNCNQEDCEFLRERCCGNGQDFTADAQICYDMYKLILLSNPNNQYMLMNDVPTGPITAHGRDKNYRLFQLALQNKDQELVKALLEIQVTKVDPKEFNLLQSHCKASTEWVQMCKEIMQNSTLPQLRELMERIEFAGMRETLSLVAALIATITFAAGFTVPGGVNSADGTYILSTNPAFVVFSISNTIAMCFSMVVLFLLLGPMIGDPQPPLTFVHCSLILLRFSLGATMLAFMTGVYAMMVPKVKWGAILVLCLCSFALLAAGTVLGSTYWSNHLKEPLQRSRVFKWIERRLPSCCLASKRNNQQQSGSTKAEATQSQLADSSSKDSQQQLQHATRGSAQEAFNAAPMNVGAPNENDNLV